MRLAGLEIIDQDDVGTEVTPGAPDAPRDRPPRGRVVSVSWAALVVAAVAVHALLLLVVRAATADGPTGDVTTGVLTELPVLLVLVVGARLACRAPTPLEALCRLGTRTAEAEAALVREHDRVHELRATLAGVAAAYRVLQDPRATRDPARRHRLQQLHDREMERLERLLSDRSDAARSIDLDAVIDPLAESLRLRGTEVTWTGTGCSAHGRPDDVTEVVHILLENAAQHGARGLVEVAVAARGRTVEIRVTDRGPGIPPHLVGRLYERGTRGTRSSGQGLGLNIARRLAHDMGGDLRLATPQPGEPGATFVLSLPAHSGAGSCRAAPS